MDDEEDLRKEIVLKLARKHAWGNNSISVEELVAYFPSHQRGAVKDSASDLALSDAPVSFRDTGRDRLVLGDPDSVAEYLSGYVDESHLRNILTHWGGGENPPKTKAGDDLFADEIEKIERESQSVDQHVVPLLDSMQSEMELLRDQLSESEEAAKSWRQEAARRQKISIALAIVTFVLGILATLVLQFFIF